MSPQLHYRWAFRFGLVALLVGVVLVGFAFFGRTPNGQFRLTAWAGWLAAAGIPNGLAHFLLWVAALTVIGSCFAVAMSGFCRMVAAECPACGGAARWASALQNILEKSIRELGAIRIIDSSNGVSGRIVWNPRAIGERISTKSSQINVRINIFCHY